MESKAIPDPFQHILLQLGKEPGVPLGIVPDMVRMSLATAHPLERVETPVGEPVAGGAGQTVERDEGSVQEPVRQGGIEPGVPPAQGRPGKLGLMGRDMGNHRSRVLEPLSVIPASLAAPDTLGRLVGKMPGDHELGRAGRSRRQSQGLSDAPDQRLVHRRAGGGRTANNRRVL